MAEERIEIKLVARADMAPIQDAVRELSSVDKANLKTVASLKAVETQAEKTAASVKKISTSADLQNALASNPALAARNPQLLQAATSSHATASSTASQSTPSANQSNPASPAAVESASSGIEKLIKKFISYVAVLHTVRAAIHNYVEDERAQASLDAALAQRSQLTDKYRESLSELADTLSKRTAMQGSEWLNALTTLTKFGADSGNINNLASAVENLAGATGGSLAEASVEVGKALQGNFTMLTRYGFKVDETKTRTEQLASLFEQFAQRGAGQLEARSKTLSGQFNTMTVALGNLGSAVVGATSKMGFLQFWMTQVTNAANGMAKMFGNSIERIDGMTNALGPAVGALDDATESANQTATATDKVAKAADAAAEALDREKKAMSEQSSQAIKMIEAQSKLQAAKIKASNLTPQQKQLALAALDVRTQQQVFTEQQRADSTQVHLDRQAGLDMNAELLRKENALADKKSELDAANSAQQLKADAARKTQYAEQLKRDLGFADNLSEGDQAKMVRSKISVGGAAVTDAELSTYMNESRNQIGKAESEAALARQKAEGVGEVGNTSDLRQSIDRLQKEYDTLREKYEAQQTRLSDDITTREQGQRNRVQLAGVERQTQFVELGSQITQAAGMSGPNQAPHQTQAQQANQAQLAAWAMYAEAVRTGQRELATQIYQDIRELRRQIQMLSTQR